MQIYLRKASLEPKTYKRQACQRQRINCFSSAFVSFCLSLHFFSRLLPWDNQYPAASHCSERCFSGQLGFLTFLYNNRSTSTFFLQTSAPSFKESFPDWLAAKEFLYLQGYSWYIESSCHFRNVCKAAGKQKGMLEALTLQNTLCQREKTGLDLVSKLQVPDLLKASAIPSHLLFIL